MWILYTTDKDGKEITLYASQSELKNIYEAILRLKNDPKLNEVRFKADPDPMQSEYPNSISPSSLIIKKENTAICVSIKDNAMLIRSAEKWLEILSSYFGLHCETNPRAHNHLDVHWGHESIHPDCIATVIGIQRKKE